MKRKKTDKKPDAILCADIHLRDTVPKCRIDDYWQAQQNKIEFIRQLQEKYNCLIYCAGDLFHKSKSSPYLEGWSLTHLPDNMIIIPGQHDLPNHNIDNFEKSSIGVLHASEFYTIFTNPFGEMLKLSDGKGLIHTFIQKPDDEQDRIIGGSSAKALLNKYPDLKLIVSGDNHKPFVVEHEGRLLVNPGSIMRMTIGQIEHKPRVYLWYEETNCVEPVYLPIEDNVINIEYKEIQEKRDKRIEAFITHLSDDYSISLDFKKNLENHFITNNTRKGIQDFVWGCWDG
jgi:DNA repair exonuclease SbcCD nuclease subunit